MIPRVVRRVPAVVKPRTAIVSVARVNQQHRSYSQSSQSHNWTAYLGAGAALFVSTIAVVSAEASQKEKAQGEATLNVDYKAVRKEIADLLDSPDYDDGSYGPLLVRLAWHSAGSFSKLDGSGGSNGGLLRFEPEKSWGGNKGLNIAVELLEKVKRKHPGISYGDLFTLGGVVAIEEMGGPQVPWRPGRIDHFDGKKSPSQDNRLPDAAKGASHLRDVFNRMGFSDQEIVALSGAHALGRCHTSRSGFDGPWTRSPTTFSNTYYQLLLSEKWTERKWNGPRQFENSQSGADLMMLPSDIALIEDPKMKPWVEKYANDEALFFKDFAAAFSKLLELGVKFEKTGEISVTETSKKSFMDRIFPNRGNSGRN